MISETTDRHLARALVNDRFSIYSLECGRHLKTPRAFLAFTPIEQLRARRLINSSARERVELEHSKRARLSDVSGYVSVDFPR